MGQTEKSLQNFMFQKVFLFMGICQVVGLKIYFNGVHFLCLISMEVFMKKVYLALFAVLFTFNAHAFDLATAANKVADSANKTAESVEARKAANAKAKADREAAAEAKKAELKKQVEDKKAEAKSKYEAKKAEDAAKKAEQEKAMKDAKDSLNNLKKSFGK